MGDAGNINFNTYMARMVTHKIVWLANILNKVYDINHYS